MCKSISSDDVIGAHIEAEALIVRELLARVPRHDIFDEGAATGRTGAVSPLFDPIGGRSISP